MTVEVKSYSVTLDASDNPEPLTLTPPSASGSSVWRWAVIQNVTPYTALVQYTEDSGVNTVSLGPNTENKYAFSNLHGPMRITWNNPITGTVPPGTPAVTVQFSDDPSGNELAGAYPSQISSPINIGTVTGTVTLTGPIDINTVQEIVENVGVQGVLNQIGTFSWSGTPMSVVTITCAAVPGSYTAVQAIAAGLAGGISALAMLVVDSSTPSISPQFSAGFGSVPNGSGKFQSIAKVINNVGDTLTITVFLSGSSNSGSIVIYGLTNQVIPTRLDGRAYPAGVFTAQGTTTAGGTLVAAPTGPMRIHVVTLSGLNQSSGAPGGFIAPAGVINGASVFLGVATATTSQLGGGSIAVPPQGILLDPATPLTYVTGGAETAVVVDAIYDITV